MKYDFDIPESKKIVLVTAHRRENFGAPHVEIFEAIAKQELDKITLEIDERSATTIMVVSGGYPEDYEKGKEISGLELIEDWIVFHAGTKLENGKVVSNGGRVLAVTSYGNSFEEAIKKSYQNINK